MFLQVNHLEKVFQTRFSKEKTHALSDVSFTAEQGEFIAIMGESGSGKTTLLNILATLEKPSNGDVVLEGRQISTINLLDTLSVRDNIFLPLVLARHPYKEMAARLAVLAPKLSILALLDKQPFELSGGQKQRVAIARALITNPKLILADEPTAALDSKNSDVLLDLFEQINADGQTVLMVTHSSLAASHASRVLFIKDGKIFHQLYRGDKTPRDFNLDIMSTMTAILGGE